MKILFWLIFSIASGIAYRFGGIGKPFNTKWRDLGIPCLMTVYMLLLDIKFVWWVYLLNFGLLFGALTTYFGLDEKKWGYWAHGLAISFSALPIVYITGHWLGFAIRTIVLTGLITIISEYLTQDWLEEGGRGFFIMATLPILLWG